MIKGILEVQSKNKLFKGLSIAISGFMMFYTLLNIFVIKEDVPFFGILFSKWVLLLIPIISALYCTFCLVSQKNRGQKLPSPYCNNTYSEESKKILLDGIYFQAIFSNFLFQLAFFFLQIGKLNSVKNLQSFSVIIPPLLILSVVIYMVVSTKKLMKIK